MIEFCYQHKKQKKEGTSMNTRLSRIIENFTSKVMGRFSQDNILTVEEMEDWLWKDSCDFVKESVATYAEMIDREHVRILDNLLRWKERKKAQKSEAELWENTERNMMRTLRRMRSSYRMQAQNR
jgi:hypothetical protein